MYTDRSMACADCGQEFTFTAGEQEFYAQRGFTEPPKRCSSCRQIRKAQRNRGSSDGPSRGDGYGSRNENGGYGGDSYGSASSGYGGGAYASSGYSASGGYSAGGYSSGSERRQREMFEATCANCGKTASVPFRPSGSKPVYCSDCFESRR